MRVALDATLDAAYVRLQEGREDRAAEQVTVAIALLEGLEDRLREIEALRHAETSEDDAEPQPE